MFERRRRAFAAIEDCRKDDVGHFTSGLEKHLKEYYGFGDNDATWYEPSPLKTPDRAVLAKTVKQYTPIWREQVQRFMNDYWWFHGLGEPLVEPEDLDTWGALSVLAVVGPFANHPIGSDGPSS